MRDFAAIDFETANNERSSVCSWRDSRFFLLTYSARAQLLQLLVLTSAWFM